MTSAPDNESAQVHSALPIELRPRRDDGTRTRNHSFPKRSNPVLHFGRTVMKL